MMMRPRNTSPISCGIELTRREASRTVVRGRRRIVLQNEHPLQIQAEHPPPDGEVRQKTTDCRSREREVTLRSFVDPVRRRSEQPGDLAVRQPRALDSRCLDQPGQSDGRHAA